MSREKESSTGMLFYLSFPAAYSLPFLLSRSPPPRPPSDGERALPLASSARPPPPLGPSTLPRGFCLRFVRVVLDCGVPCVRPADPTREAR